ncbi:MAG: aminotransferase class V-fold PLP-dependent enzyme, partial [Blastocatellia bacterium]
APAYEAMEEYIRSLRDNGLPDWERWLAKTRHVRGLCAQLINAAAREIAFAQNTSAALSVIANGIAWRAGDNVVSADCEFPANVQPWLRVKREYGVELRRAAEREGRLETGEILELIDARTRVVALSFVEFGSGFRNDLATIGRYCRERDILFVVDAIQGLGALQLDVERDCIDALAADAHKFLLGPDGIAILYVSARAMPRITPTLSGWLSIRNPNDHANPDQPWAESAKRYEPGSHNSAGIYGLGASVELMLRIGTARIESYLLELTDYLCAGLVARGYEIVSSRRPGEASAVVCCRHEQYSAEQLYERLNEHRIITTPRLGRLRISPHFYNNRADIEQLLEALPR